MRNRDLTFRFFAIINLFKWGFRRFSFWKIPRYFRNLTRYIESKLAERSIAHVDLTNTNTGEAVGVCEIGYSEPVHPIIPRDVPSDRFVVMIPPLLRKPCKVMSYEHAYILGSSPVVFSTQGRPIIEAMGRNERRIRNTFKRDPTSVKNFLQGRRPKELHEGQFVLMHSGWNNYGHWVTEHLPKAIYLRESDRTLFENVNYLLEYGAPNWKRDALISVGVKTEKIVEFDGRNQGFICESLIVPNYPEPHREIYKLISQDFLSKKNGSTSYDCCDRLYLARDVKDSNVRKILNDAELTEALQREGIQKIYPERFNIFEQAHIFNRSSLVLGPNGSAFTNLIHMKPKSHVLEIFGNRLHFGFRQIALEMGLSHEILYAKLSARSAKLQHSGKIVDGDLVVNVSEVISKIRSR